MIGRKEGGGGSIFGSNEGVKVGVTGGKNILLLECTRVSEIFFFNKTFTN